MMMRMMTPSGRRSTQHECAGKCPGAYIPCARKRRGGCLWHIRAARECVFLCFSLPFRLRGGLWCLRGVSCARLWLVTRTTDAPNLIPRVHVNKSRMNNSFEHYRDTDEQYDLQRRVLRFSVPFPPSPWVVFLAPRFSTTDVS